MGGFKVIIIKDKRFKFLNIIKKEVYMKTKLKILTFIILAFPFSIFSQWQSVSENQFPDIIHVGYALDAIENCALVSFMYSDSQGVYSPYNLFKTNDNGQNWLGIDLPNHDKPTDIAIVDELNYLVATNRGRILQTKDGGVHWDIQFENNELTEFMNYIEMFDANNGIAMGDGFNNKALIIGTKDGGLNWVNLNDSSFGGYSFDIWRMIDFVNPNIGYFCASSVSTTGLVTNNLFKTENGCTDWEFLETNNKISTLKFFDKDHGIILTSSGKDCKRTLDGGKTWENIPFNFTDRGNDIEYVDNDYQNVWVITQHKVFFSSDFGDTWTQYPFSEDIWFYDIHFTDQNKGWLLTTDGIYVTQNNGGYITDVESNKIINNFDLYQNYPNPFNPTTTIKYEIPNVAYSKVGDSQIFNSSRNVQIRVYDVLGKEIATLVNENKPVGEYEVTFDASELNSGVYFYQLKADNYIETKKMILLR